MAEIPSGASGGAAAVTSPPPPPPSADSTAPSAPPTPAPAPEPGTDDFDPLAALADLAHDDGKPDPTSPRPRGTDGKFQKSDKGGDKPDAKLGSNGTPDDNKPAVDNKQPVDDGKPQKAGELRRLKDLAESENKTLKAELQRLKTAKPAPDPDKERLTGEHKSLTEKLEKAQAQIAEYESEIERTNFAGSQKFKDEFHKPFTNAWMDGHNLVSNLDVVERTNPETGEITRKGRPGDPKDFDAVMQAPDYRTAKAIAKDLFGDDAGEVLVQRKTVQDLANKRKVAIDEHNKMAQEHAQNLNGHRQQAQQYFEQQVNEGAQSRPQWFVPNEADPEGNKHLEEGMHWARRAFQGGAQLREGDKPLTPQQLIKLQASMLNMAGAFRRMAYFDKQKSAKIAQLESQLEEFESSRPKGGEGGKRTTEPATDDSASGAFATHFKR